MAMKFEELIQILDRIAPEATQESWDNSGVQLAGGNCDVARVLTSLELTDEIIDEAIREEADVIITHHPMIFGGIKSIDYRDVTGSYIVRLMNEGIAVYSSHTPFDKADGGNNDFLAEAIGLRDISGFTDGENVDMIGRIGVLPQPMTLAAMADLISEALCIDAELVRCVGDLNDMIKTVGICTGAGADLMDLAIENGCQLFITGDLKYHDAQRAKAMGISVIDAGHYGTEKTFAENYACKLRELTAGRIEVIESKVDIDPFVIL